MTVVNTETGEIFEGIDTDEARRLTTEAQTEFRSSREHFDRAWSLIEQAVEGGGHLALGYRSPGDYLRAEFDGVLSGLDVTARRVAVRAMSEWGLSTRAIAPVVGVNFGTVSRDLGAGVAPATPGEPDDDSQVIPQVSPGPAPADVDEKGVSQADTLTRTDGVSTADAIGGSQSASTPAVSASNVIGIDGKTYKRPKVKPRPAAEKTLNAISFHADKAAREAASLTSDQIRRMRPEAGAWTAGLRQNVEALQRLLDSLDND